MTLTIIEKNLLFSTEDYICHQTNCVTKKSAGFSRALFRKFPDVDIYKSRKGRSMPGKISVYEKTEKRPGVIHMMAQYYPGKAKPDGKDSKKNRLKYFLQCLDSMKKMEGSFSFPFRVGCGLAGGHWPDYLELLNDFAQGRKVVLYKL